jgi:glycosyltransferase involved in cell wall biosynthesis
MVAFEDHPHIQEVCDLHPIVLPACHQWPFAWRFAAQMRYQCCVRGLRQAQLSVPDVVIGGEHLFLREHARRFPGIPWLYLPHSLLLHHEIDSYHLAPMERWLTLRLYTWLQKWALSHADLTLRFTQYGCRVLQEYYGPKLHPRFVVNPIGIEIPGLGQARSSDGIPHLLSVGTLTSRKRINVAIEALAAMQDVAWTYDIIGDGHHLPVLKQRAAQLGIADRVHFHGYQADPTPWYQKANLLLMPSHSESLGLAVLEAMSYSVPVLAMKADGKQFFNPNDEIINDGIDGYLTASDVHFQHRLQQLLSDPAALVEAGAKARRKIEHQYSWDRHLDQYEQIFAALLRLKTRLYERPSA